MGKTDPIADSLVILKNATLVKKEEASIPFSKLLFKACEILKQEGYIENYRKIEENKKNFIKVYLKYRQNSGVINQVQKVSKSSRKVYVDKENIPRVLNGRGLAIMSTPIGVVTDSLAREKNVGGEVLFYIW